MEPNQFQNHENDDEPGIQDFIKEETASRSGLEMNWS